MVTLWYVKIKFKLSKLEEVPDRYYDQVLEMLVENNIFDEEGSRL